MPRTERRTLSIEARVKDFATRAFRTMGKGVKGFADFATRDLRRAGGAVKRLEGLITGLVGFLSVRQGFRFFKDTADGIDEIAKNADRMQATVRSLQAFEFAAGLAGTSTDKVNTAIKRFSRNVDQARRGNTEYADALRDLGIDMENLPLGPGGRIDIIALLGQAGDAYTSLEDRTRAAAAAQIIFGRSGAELGPLLAVGSQGLREQAAEYERLAGVLSDEDVRQAAEFNDSILRVTTSVRGFMRVVFLELAPGLTDFFNNTARDIAEFRSRITGEVKEFAIRVLSFVQDIGEGLSAVFVVLGTRLQAFILAIQGASSLIRLFQAVLSTFRREEIEKQDEAWNELGSSIQTTIETMEGLLDLKPELELADRIQEIIRNLAESVERGSADLVETARATSADLEEAYSPFFASFLTKSAEIWDRFVDLAQQGQQAATELVGQGLDRLVSTTASIITTTKSAKEAFRDYARFVLDQLAKIIVRLFIAKAIQGAIFGGLGGASSSGFDLSAFGEGPVQPDPTTALGGFERGGVARGTVARTIPIRAYESGGVARGPQIAVFGEGRASRGEAFVPLPDGRTIPVTMTGGAPVLNFYIQAWDGADVHRTLVRHRSSIMSVWNHAVSHDTQARQGVQRVVA